jgi:PEP-CTERM motif
MAWHRLSGLILTVMAAAPANAVTAVSQSIGNGTPWLRDGESLLVTFDRAAARGIDITSSGRVIDGIGSISGLRTAPKSAKDGYRAITAKAASSFDFRGWSGGRPLSMLSLDWGTIDSYNFVDFLDAKGGLVASFSGASLPITEGRTNLIGASRRLLFRFVPTERVTTMRLRSTGNSLEFDNVAAAISDAVPEPSVWAFLIIGFGMVGGQLRRRRRHAVLSA